MKINEFEEKLLNLVSSEYLKVDPDRDTLDEIEERARITGTMLGRMLAVVRHQGPANEDLLLEMQGWEEFGAREMLASVRRHSKANGLTSREPPASKH